MTIMLMRVAGCDEQAILALHQQVFPGELLTVAYRDVDGVQEDFYRFAVPDGLTPPDGAIPE